MWLNMYINNHSTTYLEVQSLQTNKKSLKNSRLPARHCYGYTKSWTIWLRITSTLISNSINEKIEDQARTWFGTSKIWFYAFQRLIHHSTLIELNELKIELNIFQLSFGAQWPFLNFAKNNCSWKIKIFFQLSKRCSWKSLDFFMKYVISWNWHKVGHFTATLLKNGIEHVMFIMNYGFSLDIYLGFVEGN